MKAADWRTLVTPLLPPTESWQFEGRLCYRQPVGRFLFGALAEGSSFDRGIYIWKVSTPLFVPSNVLVLTYSKRLSIGGGKYTSSEVKDFTAAVTSALTDIPSEDDELHRLVDEAHTNRTLRPMQVATYCHVLLGEIDSGRDLIDRIAHQVTIYEWENKIKEEIANFGRVLEVQGSVAAREILDRNVADVAAALKIERDLP